MTRYCEGCKSILNKRSPVACPECGKSTEQSAADENSLAAGGEDFAKESVLIGPCFKEDAKYLTERLGFTVTPDPYEIGYWSYFAGYAKPWAPECAEGWDAATIRDVCGRQRRRAVAMAGTSIAHRLLPPEDESEEIPEFAEDCPEPPFPSPTIAGQGVWANMGLLDALACAASEEDIDGWMPTTESECVSQCQSLGLPSDASAYQRMRCWSRYQHAEFMLAERNRRLA